MVKLDTRVNPWDKPALPSKNRMHGRRDVLIERRRRPGGEDAADVTLVAQADDFLAENTPGRVESVRR